LIGENQNCKQYFSKKKSGKMPLFILKMKELFFK